MQKSGRWAGNVEGAVGWMAQGSRGGGQGGSLPGDQEAGPGSSGSLCPLCTDSLRWFQIPLGMNRLRLEVVGSLPWMEESKQQQLWAPP